MLAIGLCGCRKPNPAWQGAEAGNTIGVASETADGPEDTDVTAGATADTGAGVATVGAACINNGECPPELRCGPNGCQRGEAGEPCENGDDCGLEAPVCSEGMCDPGALGQPCSGHGECDPLRCGPVGVCQAGRGGDPCDNASQCSMGVKCADGRCA